jgi:hypothetical protein
MGVPGGFGLGKRMVAALAALRAALAALRQRRIA